MLEAVKEALRAHSVAQGELCIVLTSNEEVRELNRVHRSIDEPTDVLTFPAPALPHGSHHGPSSREDLAIGDVVIAVPFAQRQAEARRVNLETELGYLAIHGVLHLVGMEDESDEGRRAMQLEGARLAELAGLVPDPDWTTLKPEPEPAR